MLFAIKSVVFTIIKLILYNFWVVQIVCAIKMQLIMHKLDTCYKNHGLNYYIPKLIYSLYLLKLCIVILYF
jgi:hypothetical protein